MWSHPVFVINLKARADRRDAVAASLAAVGLTPTFIEAVDGRTLSDEKLALQDVAGRLRRAPKPLTAGEIGCYLSHWSIFERMVEEDILQAVVLEDDAVVTAELPAVLDALAVTDTPDYDMVKLGDCEPREKSFARIQTLTKGAFLVRHHAVCNCNVGYVITRDGAEKFMRYGMPIRYPIDVAMNRSWRHGLDILAVRPWPILHDLGSTSSIGDSRFSKAPEKTSAPDKLRRLERRLRKAYDSLAKRLDVGRRLKRDAAWRRRQLGAAG